MPCPRRSRRRARPPTRSQRPSFLVTDASPASSASGGGAAQVPARHHVGERVVVDRLVVLVWPDHAVDVGGPVAVAADPGRPVACGLDEQVASRPRARTRCRRPIDVAAGGPGDVRHDVLLDLAGADRHEASAARIVHLRRGDVGSGVGRLPREARAARARLRARPPARPGAGASVLEHRPCGSRVRRGQERQHEDVGVPEHMAAVAGPRQPARADGRLTRSPRTTSGGTARTAPPAATRRRRRCGCRRCSHRRAQARAVLSSRRSKPAAAARFAAEIATVGVRQSGARAAIGDVPVKGLRRLPALARARPTTPPPAGSNARPGCAGPRSHARRAGRLAPPAEVRCRPAGDPSTAVARRTSDANSTASRSWWSAAPSHSTPACRSSVRGDAHDRDSADPQPMPDRTGNQVGLRTPPLIHARHQHTGPGPMVRPEGPPVVPRRRPRA